MTSDSTRWTLIRRAAAGSADDRAEFVGRYGSIIRAYLGARWRNAARREQIEDAVQQVFLDCFKASGALSRADSARSTGFRGFLYGIVRNVARETERAWARAHAQLDDETDLDAIASKEDSLAQVFDRAWAAALLRDAAARQLELARAKGPDAIRRHELLELRYGENLPIREIALRWQVEPGWLHGQYRQARAEFRSALEDLVRDLKDDATGSVEAECRRLLQHFS